MTIFAVIFFAKLMIITAVFDMELIWPILSPFFWPYFICNKILTIIRFAFFPNTSWAQIVMFWYTIGMIFTTMLWQLFTLNPISILIDTKRTTNIGTWLTVDSFDCWVINWWKCVKTRSIQIIISNLKLNWLIVLWC